MSHQPPLRLGERRSDAHKGTFGRVLLVGGSRGMSGSIAMSAMASLRTGAGLVSVAVPDRCLETVASFDPCVMTIPMADDGKGRFSIESASELPSAISGATAIGCGPGMTVEAGPIRLVERLLAEVRLPRVLDADAINILARLGWPQEFNFDVGSLILTPHPGEFSRLTGVDSKDRSGQIDAAKRLCEQTGVTIVVKGGPTVVVSREIVWTNTTGNAGMATAGSGDVLTGVITSLLAQGLCPADAARLGVWTHGLAGDLAAERLGQPGMTAVDLLDALPEAISAA